MTVDVTELMKLITTTLALLGGVVALVVAVLSLRRARLELEKEREKLEAARRSGLGDTPPGVSVRIMVVTLSELEELGPSPTFWADRLKRSTKATLNGFAGPFTPLFSATLAFLRPALIPEHMQIPNTAVRRLRAVPGWIALSVILIASPVARLYRGPEGNSPVMFPTARQGLVYLAALVIALIVLRVSDAVTLRSAA